MARLALLSFLVIGFLICALAQDFTDEPQPRGCRIFLRGGMVYRLQPVRTVHVFVGGPHSPEEVAAFVSMLLDHQAPALMSYPGEERAESRSSMVDEPWTKARAQDSEQEQAAEGGVRGREGFEVSSGEEQDQVLRGSGHALGWGWQPGQELVPEDSGFPGEGGMVREEEREETVPQAVRSGWDMPEWPRAVLSTIRAANIQDTISSLVSAPFPFQHLRQLALRFQPDLLADARTRQLALLRQQQQQSMGRRFGGWAPNEDTTPSLPEAEAEAEAGASSEVPADFGETDSQTQAADDGMGEFPTVFSNGAMPVEVVETLQRLRGMAAALRGVLEGDRVEEQGSGMEWEPAARVEEFDEEDKNSAVERVAEFFKDMMLEVEHLAFSMGGLPLLLLPCLLIAAVTVAQHVQYYEEPETTIFVVTNARDVEQPLLDSDNESKDGSEHGDEHNNPLAGYQPPKV